ncbi:hypothetical protein CT0861_13220, partial [Colletotrichum tofieldiae]
LQPHPSLNRTAPANNVRPAPWSIPGESVDRHTLPKPARPASRYSSNRARNQLHHPSLCLRYHTPTQEPINASSARPTLHCKASRDTFVSQRRQHRTHLPKSQAPSCSLPPPRTN